MTDLRTFINYMAENSPVSEKSEFEAISAFLIDNKWFGCEPIVENGIPMLSPEQISVLSEKLQRFLCEEGSSNLLLNQLANKFPETTKYLTLFYQELKANETDMFYLTDFLLFNLNKEMFFCSDDDITDLLKVATNDLVKFHGDLLTFFIAWLRTKAKTRYHKDYTMERRYTMDIQNEAYEFDEYLELMYKLFNDDYIEDNEMFRKAAESVNFTDTWLYLAMHFICSLRYTDLVRIYRPLLPLSPEECIAQIADSTFSDNDARLVLLSITQRMCTMPFTPNKTQSKNGIGSIKLCFPTSCEILFGKLFTLAEAHRQLTGDFDSPIIRKISTYNEITRYMGSDIGDIFLESDFRSRSATKSYLQAVCMLGDEMSETNDGINAKGYLLAALARSHKGSYGEFASTTFEYLKDAKLNGLTPEFVAFELFERGVLSFISSELLSMVTNGTYSKMPTRIQTQMIQELDLSLMEIESIVSLVDNSRKCACDIVKTVTSNEKDPLLTLHLIGSGQAFSKQPECMCLLTAINQVCPYPDKRQCVGCDYEISTKSTMYLLISEYNRMKDLYLNATDKLEKTKYKKLITQVITPKMNEMLECLKKTYGDDIYQQYEQLIKENT